VDRAAAGTAACQPRTDLQQPSVMTRVADDLDGAEAENRQWIWC
jgi:hypothetical protein